MQNGSMELWGGDKLLQHPENWTTTEQALGVKTNQWVFRETIPGNMHSGLNAVRLYTDTTSFLPGRPVELTVWSGMIAYGKAAYVNNKLITSGMPIYGRPVSLSMYAKIYHPVSDTATVRILLTRWNHATHRPDTLAYDRRDILPDSTVMNGFAFFIDSINYLADGPADTARVIIMGGHRNNLQTQGNTVWIDDLNFNYPSEQVVFQNIEDELFLYPDPATTKLYIKARTSLIGYKVTFVDLAGIKIKDVTLDDSTTAIDVADMHDGKYSYAVLDADGKPVHEGKINIMKDRP